MTAVKRNEIEKKGYPQEEGAWSFIGKNGKKDIGRTMRR